MTDNRANKGTYRKTRSTAAARDEDDWPPLTQPSRSSSPTLHEENEAEDATLHSILSEIKDFRRDNNHQLAEIKQELHSTNDRLEEAEGRIEEAETALQAMATLMKKLMNRQASMEAKITDQEGRARRDNLRIHGIPEKEEGDNMCAFLEKLLSDTLDIRELRIERAHRSQAPAPAPEDSQARPRSIIAKFTSYKVKEEVIRRAWQKKAVYYKNTRFFVDHDYPAAVLKKRYEYTEAKKILRERKIKFQTPYPAKLRVHYDDGTQTYQNAADATADMVKRGLPVTVITAPIDRDHRELQLLSSWQTAGVPRGTSDVDAGAERQEKSSHRSYKERLQQFKHTHPTK